MQPRKYSNLIQKLKTNSEPEKTPTEPIKAPEAKADELFDLSAHLNQQPAATPPPAPDTDSPVTDAEPEQRAEEIFSEADKTLTNTITDPDLLADGLTDLADLARQFGYPLIYEKIMFKGPEQKAAQMLLAKVATGGKATGGEALLLQKLTEYQTHVNGIAWNGNEKAQIKKYIVEPYVKKLEGTEAIVKYFPFLILASIEGKRFKAVSNSSNTVYTEVEPQPERKPHPQQQQPAPPAPENKPEVEEQPAPFDAENWQAQPE